MAFFISLCIAYKIFHVITFILAALLDDHKILSLSLTIMVFMLVYLLPVTIVNFSAWLSFCFLTTVDLTL